MYKFNFNTDLLNEYSSLLKEIDSKIQAYSVVIKQKNKNDLLFVLNRMDYFKDFDKEILFNELGEELKSKKLGRSFNEYQIILINKYMLSPICELVQNKLIQKENLIIDDWIKDIDADLDNKDDLFYMVNKFIFRLYHYIKSLVLIWDQKEIQNFPREDFIKLNKLALSIHFKEEKDIDEFIGRNKNKTRIALFKLQGIYIDSQFQNALGYLKRLEDSE